MASSGGEEPDESVWYVSNAGNSGGGHSEGNPIDPESFASADVQVGDTVYFNKGETIVFEYDVPVNGMTFGSYGTGDDPILCGSTDYGGATWTSEGSGIYSTPISDEVKWVFIDGIAARQGESDWIPITSAPSGTTRGALTATLNAFNSVQSLVGAKLRVKEFNFRYSFEMNITAYNSGTGVLTTSETFSGAAVNYPFRLYGQLQFVTQNGDWWWDDAANKLYVKSAATPAGTDIRVTFADSALYAEDIDGLTVSGIEFQHYYRAAIETDSSSNVDISDVNIHDNRTNGLWFYGNSTGLVVDNFTIADCGRCGVFLGALQGPTFTNFTMTEIGTQANISWPIDTRFRKHCGAGVSVTDEPTATIKLPSAVTVQDFNISHTGGQGVAPYGDDWLIERGEVSYYAEKWDDVGGISTFYVNSFGAGLSTKDGIIRDVIVHDGIGNHEGIASFTSVEFTAGIYLDNGTETWEVDNCTVYNNPFAGIFVNWNTFGQNIHDCTLYNNGTTGYANMFFYELPNGTDSPNFLHNYGNIVENCTFLIKRGQYAIATASAGSGADASYNPYSSGGSADNNKYVYPNMIDTYFKHGLGTASFTAINLAAWKVRNGEDAASVVKNGWLQDIASTFGESTIVILPNPSGSTVALVPITGFYRDYNDVNITSVDVPAWSSTYGLIRPDYYYLMDDFTNENGTNISGKAPFIGNNANVIAGAHTVQNGIMQSSSPGSVSWNIGATNYKYETVVTTITAASTSLRMDLRLQDNTTSATNRIIVDFVSGNLQFREYFSSASPVQTLTTPFTIANSTSYRLVAHLNGTSVKIYVDGVLKIDATVQLITGNWQSVSGEVNRRTDFITAYKLTP